MVVDSSALAAVLLGEKETEDFLRILARPERKLISAFTWLELCVVVEAKKGPRAVASLREFALESELDIVPFDAGQAELALDAWRRFGKGRHPAGLNIGDCTSYALARFLNQALLFKGEDFGKTDIAGVR